MHQVCFYCHQKGIFFTFFVLHRTPGVIDTTLTDRTLPGSDATLLQHLIGQWSQVLSSHWSHGHRAAPGGVWAPLSAVRGDRVQLQLSEAHNGSALSIISRPVRRQGGQDWYHPQCTPYYTCTFSDAQLQCQKYNL